MLPLLVLVVCALSLTLASPLPPTFLPFPIPQSLPSTVYQVDYDDYNVDDQLVLISLQGALAKKGIDGSVTGLLYKVTGNSSGDTPDDSQWVYWDYYRRAYPQVVFDDATLKSAPLAAILTTFLSDISGFIYTVKTQAESDATNIALSLAGTKTGVIVGNDAHLSLFQSLGIKQWRDVRSYTEATFIAQYRPFNASGAEWPFSRRFFSSQAPGKSAQYLSDWVIFAGAFQMHHKPTVRSTINALPEGQLFAVLGWTADDWSENEFTGTVSSAGGVVWAADTVDNLATHAYFNAPTQRDTRPMTNPTRTRGAPQIDNVNKYTVAFLWSDGDALAADLNGAVTKERWRSPHRGMVPQTWSLDPSLAHLAPSQLQYFYDTSKQNDSIIAFSPGYAYPDYFNTSQQLANWALTGAEAMNMADMSINLMIGFNYTYTSFEPVLSNWNVDGLIYFDYPNYYILSDNRNGSVLWVHDKPAIAIRDSLWGGFSTPQSVANTINAQSRDHTSVGGYSVVCIHMWTQTVDTVNAAAALFDDDVVVVKLDDLVSLMTSQVSRDTETTSVPQAPQASANRASRRVPVPRVARN